MIKEDYSIACAEVIKILEYIPYKDYKKIPKDIILHYKENANKNYDFEYDTKYSLNEQNISKTAKTIIAIFFRDYWATPKQKKKILDYEKNGELFENKMYNINNILENRKKKKHKSNHK